MTRLLENLHEGTISAAATAAATTLQSAGFQNLPVVTSPDIIPIVLESGSDHEIAWVTAHSSGSSSVTVKRNAETKGNTTNTALSIGDRWWAAVTAADYDPYPPDRSDIHSASDEFDDNTFDGWTFVDIASTTYTIQTDEQRSALGLDFVVGSGTPGANAYGFYYQDELAAANFPGPPATVMICFSPWFIDGDASIGIFLADGITQSDTCVILEVFWDESAGDMKVRDGDGTFASVTQRNNTDVQHVSQEIILMLVWVSSNEFDCFYSLDGGRTYNELAMPSKTLTPDQFGIVLAEHGSGASKAGARIEYVRLFDADLSPF